MRWIEKGREPKSLTEYRTGPDAAWDNCPTACKDDIRDALLAEQGHLCAYCMRRIYRANPDMRRNMKIEHWKPRNLLDEAGKLNFQNMLGVCPGSFDVEKNTCDTRKGGAEISVDPRRKEHIGQISYVIDDAQKRVLIKSENEAIQEDLSRHLNLNDKRLAEYRYRAYMALRKSLPKSGTWSVRLLDKLRSTYETPDTDGKLPEYAGFLLWWLDRRRRRTQ